MPRSASANAAATVTGLVIEATRKMVSRCIGSPASTSRKPISLTCNTFPRCHTRVTAPASSPESTASRMEAWLSSRLTARVYPPASRGGVLGFAAVDIL